MKLDRTAVIQLIYGEGPVQRFTQDSPILPDVWIAFAEDPSKPQDLLLTPHQSSTAQSLPPGKVSEELQKRLEADWKEERWERTDKGKQRDTAYNQTTVAVRLWFDQLVRVVIPMSAWWQTRVMSEELYRYLPDASDKDDDEELIHRVARWLSAGQSESGQVAPDVLWMIRVIGTIARAASLTPREAAQLTTPPATPAEAEQLWPPPKGNAEIREKFFEDIYRAFCKLMQGVKLHRDPQPYIHLASLNRRARASVWRSANAVKADAANRVFALSCRELAWAVVDSGIDARHPAFRRRNGVGELDELPGRGSWARHSRVIGTFDFTRIRSMLMSDTGADDQVPVEDARPKLTAAKRRELRTSLQTGREIDWALLKEAIEIPHDKNYRPPSHAHGTHVAGVLGADRRPTDPDRPVEQEVRGMCPDINIYDLRVLDENGEGDEFCVMAALQFVRYLNLHRDFMVIHGVNLSLSIPHDVMNYACGRTPVCDECERLVGSGLVVVAAAGNEGYNLSRVAGNQEGYRSISITDPGNADGVITVGATHRDSPHTYGVSYFSSRGPTGDGRCKPDIVAPGEKIEAPVPGEELRRMDGTSMAAPHVSGAAALLMARYAELIGRPRRIKEILCASATDLGRERYFQGAGMLDVLRALQSV
jgi:serine protease AprX